MSQLSLHNLTIAFGGQPLLDGISLDIQKSQRICILGRNGVGKSTLMKIIAGHQNADSGDIIKGSALSIAYLPQDVPSDICGSLFEVVASGAGESGINLAKWHKLSLEPHDDKDLAALQHQLDENNGWQIETMVTRVLDQVQLDANADFASLSGGMRRRALLARALVCNPEILLLDEPTNHLDIESIRWLESFLLNSRLTVIFVTHDRRFLKKLATRIIELDRGHLYDWSCNYETFLVRKQAVLDAEEKDWNRFDKKMAQEEVWIRKGVQARRTRNEGRVRALLRMRSERAKRREKSGGVAMAISAAERSGDRVLVAKDVTFSYDVIPIISQLTTTIIRGDRIGIIGPNGCGKTTLLNLLLDKLAPTSGTIVPGVNLKVVYFDQLRSMLDLQKTVWENVAPDGADTVFINGQPRHIISYLQDFLFTSDRARSPVSQLSGGERNRIMLARLFTQPANVLVFDEPTNDLDAETLELLEELLMDYPGTILVVSHDREFLNNVVTATLAFEPNGVVKEYIGGFDDWERQSLQQQKPTSENSKKKEQMPSQASPLKKLSFKEKQELEKLPHQIEDKERIHGELVVELSIPTNFQKDGFAKDNGKKIVSLEAELKKDYARWEELESKSK